MNSLLMLLKTLEAELAGHKKDIKLAGRGNTALAAAQKNYVNRVAKLEPACHSENNEDMIVLRNAIIAVKKARASEKR